MMILLSGCVLFLASHFINAFGYRQRVKRDWPSWLYGAGHFCVHCRHYHDGVWV